MLNSMLSYIDEAQTWNRNNLKKLEATFDVTTFVIKIMCNLRNGNFIFKISWVQVDELTSLFKEYTQGKLELHVMLGS